MTGCKMGLHLFVVYAGKAECYSGLYCVNESIMNHLHVHIVTDFGSGSSKHNVISKLRLLYAKATGKLKNKKYLAGIFQL